MLVNYRGVPEGATIQISESDIDVRIDQIAEQIADQYQGQSIVLIGVLTGAVGFTIDLGRALFQHGVTDIQLGFISVSSYRKGSHRDDVRIDLDVKFSIKDRIVILVEDIIDSGHTLKAILRLLWAKEPQDIKTAVLFRKASNIEVPPADAPVDFMGFELNPKLWGIGFFLDVDEQYRFLPDVWGILPQ